MDNAAVRKLADTQLQTFADNDYVTPELFNGMCSAIVADFPEERFSFLDVGGGRGFFADRLLERFPNATGTVLDNSELLLSMNVADPRKTLALASATEMSGHVHERFDVVFFNLSLHHFVSGTYRKSRQLQDAALREAVKMLADGGRIVVTENLFDGLLTHNAPGVLIYHLTSSKALAPIISRFGANTAGCGVCFLSARAWRSVFEKAGLREADFGGQLWRERKLSKRIFLRLLGVRSVTRAFFWLAP